MPRMRITEDTLWYDHSYRQGDEVVVEGREYLDLLRAGRVETLQNEKDSGPAVLDEEEIEGKHQGELIFVFGNGPSLALAKPYISEFSRFTTIGVNNSFLMLHTDYLLFLDAVMWVRKSAELMSCGSRVFCPKKLNIPCFSSFGRYRGCKKGDALSRKWKDGLFWSRSSGVAAINLAFIFGAAEIAILGIDLCDNSHFYSMRGRDIVFPRAARIIKDLKSMAQKLRESGVKLWNCSPDSAVEAFTKIELGKLLSRR